MYDRKWVTSFCEMMTQERLGITWGTTGRINLAQKELLALMKEAGCLFVVMAIESGSDRIRNDILGKNVSRDQMYKAYALCHEVGMLVQANIMIGIPTETMDDLRESVAVIERVRPHWMNFSFTTALPKTYMFDEYSATLFDVYTTCEKYWLGEPKQLACDIPLETQVKVSEYFRQKYLLDSFFTRARHIIEFPDMRRIVLRRWQQLLFKKHRNIKHFLYDVVAIILGSIIYYGRKVFPIRDPLS